MKKIKACASAILFVLLILYPAGWGLGALIGYRITLANYPLSLILLTGFALSLTRIAEPPGRAGAVLSSLLPPAAVVNALSMHPERHAVPKQRRRADPCEKAASGV